MIASHLRRSSGALGILALVTAGCASLSAASGDGAAGRTAEPHQIHQPAFPNVEIGPDLDVPVGGDDDATDTGEGIDDGDGATNPSVGDGAPVTTEAAPIELPPISVPTGDGWTVVFHDDFSGPDLDPVWNTCYWWQSDGGCTISSNGELEWYRPEAVSVADGELRLTATADPQRSTEGVELPYRSGMVSTGPVDSDADPSFAFTYGVVSVRAKLTDGVGTWPAIWLLSADKRSVPEIDILEQYGGRPGLITSHVHAEIGEFRFWERFESEVEDVSSSWHVYTVRWHPDRVVFEVDGVETGRVTDPRFVPSTPMYLIANLAMGGVAGAVDDDALPQTFRIDEVVISQQVGS